MADISLVSSTPGLPDAVVRRGISESQWRTLFNLFPGGKPDSVLMVWDYCRSRQLDPMKKPCHIVPMDYKDAHGQWQKRDVVMPGIYEYRITAQRTGLYLGHTEPEYGPDMELAGVKAPAWCAMTFFRWNDKAREKVPFPVKVWFTEVVATNRDGNANARWTKAPIQMLTKCTEAAGLREAFPEEFGGEQTAEEMDGRPLSYEEDSPRPGAKPAQRKSAGAEPVTSAEGPPKAEATATEVTPEAEKAPADAPVHIGTITNLKTQAGGVLAVTLNTGFRCATKNPDFIAALGELAEKGAVIELVTKTPRDPRFARTIEEIVPILDEESAS